MQRLDKILSEAGCGSRKELRTLIRSGAVMVNGTPVCREDEKFEPKDIQITINGRPVQTIGTIWLMLHKPVGYVTSVEDPRDVTVMELLPEEYCAAGIFPVGRLDKMTSGLLIFTNDGSAAHRMISPKYAVEKQYRAEHEGTATEEDMQAFAEGMVLRDGTKCRPAQLVPLGPGRSEIVVTEGKYHQVRRMMAARGMAVTGLKRLREGMLELGDLPVGACRRLTETEISQLLH